MAGVGASEVSRERMPIMSRKESEFPTPSEEETGQLPGTSDADTFPLEAEWYPQPGPKVIKPNPSENSDLLAEMEASAWQPETLAPAASG